MRRVDPSKQGKRSGSHMAFDAGLGHVRCDVAVREVETLNILTTTHQVGVGEGMTVQLQASDREGNVFTSLQGMKFHWRADPPKVIRISSLTESNVTMTQSRRQLERQIAGVCMCSKTILHRVDSDLFLLPSTHRNRRRYQHLN